MGRSDRVLKIERVDVRVLEMPTERPESDGTLAWNATTMVLAECRAGGVTGLGWTYADASAAGLIDRILSGAILGLDPMAVPAAGARMLAAIRNQGRSGLAAAAISALDGAIWDLKARLLDLPLAVLLGAARDQIPVYASGGFTSSDLDDLGRELAGYVDQGFQRVKIKVGREPARDLDRVRAARAALGPGVELMVDANGAYQRKQALAMAEAFVEHGVTWFEEPVSSDDLEGLRLLRDRAPAGMAIVAGEYGYDPFSFRRMLEAGAVDVLMADATRCLGVSGFLRADALCDAHGLPLSAHCAPALHLHAGAAAVRLIHIEWFRDHARMEAALFDGAPQVVAGHVQVAGRPGLGLELDRREAMARAR